MTKRLNLLAVVTFISFFVLVPLVKADSSAPTAPTYISASVNQSGQIFISWSGSTDNTGVAGYYLYRNGGFLITTPGETYYTDNAPPGVYYYSAVAYDDAGNVSAQSAQSNTVSVTADNMVPTTPANFSATAGSSTVALAWDPSTDNVAVAGYYVYRNGIRVYTTDAITSNTFTDTGLQPGHTYTYTVTAYDAAGNTSNAATTKNATTLFDIQSPSSPTNLKAKVVSSGEIDLSWSASTDNVAVVGYQIWRDGNELTTTASTTYADAGLAPQTSYVYTVIAYDAFGNTSNQNSSVGAVSSPPDLTPPSIPAGFTAIASSASEVKLSWYPSTDNVSVMGYYIYRDGTQIADVITNSYVDTYLTTSTTYGYAVKAYDGSQNISPQTSAAVTTLTTPPSAPVVEPPPVVPPDNQNPPTPTVFFATTLFLGLRSSDVTNLQMVLIAHGYLGASYATGYFGSLTQKAVQGFQCAQGIVCSGTPYSTGYGLVGSRTRKALNAL